VNACLAAQGFRSSKGVVYSAFQFTSQLLLLVPSRGSDETCCMTQHLMDSDLGSVSTLISMEIIES